MPLYQRSFGLTDVGPIAHPDGFDDVGTRDELVPGLAGCVDDGVVVFEDAIGEPVLAQILPNILDRVEFGGARWQPDRPLALLGATVKNQFFYANLRLRHSAKNPSTERHAALPRL